MCAHLCVSVSVCRKGDGCVQVCMCAGVHVHVCVLLYVCECVRLCNNETRYNFITKSETLFCQLAAILSPTCGGGVPITPITEHLYTQQLPMMGVIKVNW